MKAHDTTRVPRYRLRPWEVKLAAWDAEHERSPIAVQLEVASRLAERSVSYGQVKHLRKRADYREVRETFRTGGLEAARRLFVSDLPTYAELFRWGAEHAKEKGDHRGLATYAVAAADRILPRREALDIEALNKTIVIHMTERQLAYERAPEPQITNQRYDAASGSWVDASDGRPSDPLPVDAPEKPAPAKQLPPGMMTLADAMKWRREHEQPKADEGVWTSAS